MLEDAQCDLDDVRIELAARALGEPPHGLAVAEPLPVGPVGRHRVVGVADEDDPGLERDVLAGTPSG